MDINNLGYKKYKLNFRAIPLFINSGELIKKVHGYNYYISNFGRVCKYSAQWKCLKPGINSNGYKYVWLYKKGNRKHVKIHRLVAETFIDNPQNKPYIDHVDRNRLNNHVSNLRYVTRGENNINKSIQKNNKSGHPGVHWCKGCDKWRVQINLNYKYIHIGYFESKLEAIEARQKGAIKYHGEYRAIHGL